MSTDLYDDLRNLGQLLEQTSGAISPARAMARGHVDLSSPRRTRPLWRAVLMTSAAAAVIVVLWLSTTRPSSTRREAPTAAPVGSSAISRDDIETTTTMPTSAIDGVVIVDASGIAGLADQFVGYLNEFHVRPLAVLPGATVFEQTMLQPLGDNGNSAGVLNQVLGIGGYDRFTPSETSGTVPADARYIVVLGSDGGPPAYLDAAATVDSFRGFTTTTMLTADASPQRTTSPS